MSEFTREEIVEAAEQMETNNYKVVIGRRINTLLAKHNKSQKELAEYIGVLPNVISYFCKGTRTPNTEQIIKIADFFDVTTDYLLGLTDIKKEEPAPSANDTSSNNNNSLSHINDTSKSKICQELISQAQTDLLTIYDGMSEGECRAWELGELFKTLEFAKKAGEQGTNV